MNKKEKRIWNHTVRFLAVFRHLQYKEIPIAPLLIRDFQRWCRRQYKHLPKSKAMLRNLDIQAACARYWSNLTTDIPMPESNIGKHTLVRAHLYPMIQGRHNIYIAHGRKEYERYLAFKSCRPLILLTNMPSGLKRSRNKLHKQLHSILRSKKLPRLFRQTRFQLWLKNRFPQVLRRVAQMNHVFKQYDIQHVIYGSTINHKGILAACVAQRYKIPVTNIQHGIFGVFGHLPVNANQNLVWGPSHRSFLMKYGAPMQRIEVIKPLFLRSNTKRVSTLTVKNDPTKIPTVLVALQPLGVRYNRRFISIIEQSVKLGRVNGILKCRVIYKLHPDQGSGKNIRPRALSPYSIWHPHRNGVLNDLLDQSHMCITAYSTVALEAYLRGVPVLFYGKGRRPYYLRSVPPHFNNVKQCLTWLHHFFTRKDPDKWSISVLKDIHENLMREEVPHEVDCNHTRAGGVEGFAEQK